MRLLKLSFQAFGPYVGPQEIDFESIEQGTCGSGALLLIYGPTGAGKSTIMDAITYALYGETSTTGRDAERMKSHFHPGALRTEVSLSFQIGAQRYRVYRSPRQELPRKTGLGFKKEEAQAVLVDAEETPLASRPTTVTQKIEEIIGLDSKQFRQVVILPQGKFREFLNADVRTREVILEKIFQTHFYRHIQERLKAQATDIEKQYSHQKLKLQLLLQTHRADNVHELKAQRPAIDKKGQILEAEFTECAKTLDVAQTQLQEARLNAEKKMLHVQFLQKELTAHQKNLVQMEQRIASLQKQIQRATDVLEKAKRKASAQRERLLENAHAKDLTEVERFRLQLQPDRPCPICGSVSHPAVETNEIPDLQEELKALQLQLQYNKDAKIEADTAYQHAKAQCEEASTTNGMTQVEAELAALNHSFTKAKTAAFDAQAQLSQWKMLFAQWQSALKEADAMEAQITELDRQMAVIGPLSDAANGRNSKNITWQRYVLTSMFDEVLVAASQQLYLTSQGRYQLRRCNQVLDGRSAAGLDLEVMDGFTGLARAVSTLSGGESFLAALALALGLAEIVQSYAGGIRLETLFIDEGFGSLDAQALDRVFSVLVELKQSGRLIGIISHVEELKQRIDLCLEIVTNPSSGSQIQFEPID